MRITEEERQHELFCRAKDIIEERGWWQGTSIESNGSVCTVQAMGEALREYGISDRSSLWPEYISSLRLKFARANKLKRDVVLWNDDPLRTRKEIDTAFDAAIAHTAPVVMAQDAHNFVLPSR